MNKKFMVLDGLGNPISRFGDEANPYIFYSLSEAIKFANEELKLKDEVNNNSVSIVEIITLEKIER